MVPNSHNLLPKQPNRSLIDGLRILQFVMTDSEPVRVVQVARTLGVELTRAHRLLRTLTGLGYLRQVKGRRYAHGQAVPILASQAILASGFAHHSLPILQNLLNQSGLLVAYGLFWERTVTYLFHARPGAKTEDAIAGHEVLPATRSRIGLAVLSGKDESEVTALYQGHDTAPFKSIESLLQKLRKYRAAGFAYDRGFARKCGSSKEESSLALTIPGNPNAALAFAGLIGKNEVLRRAEELREAAARIARPA